MVDIEIRNPPSKDEAKDLQLKAAQFHSTREHLEGGPVLTPDTDDDELFYLDFERFRELVIEHHIYESAEGFSPKELELLRIVQAGPDRMTFQEIKEAYTERIAESDSDEAVGTSAIQYYLRRLRDKGLLEHQHNMYSATV